MLSFKSRVSVYRHLMVFVECLFYVKYCARCWDTNWDKGSAVELIVLWRKPTCQYDYSPKDSWYIDTLCCTQWWARPTQQPSEGLTSLIQCACYFPFFPSPVWLCISGYYISQNTWHQASEYMQPMEAGRSQGISLSLVLSWALPLTASCSPRNSCCSQSQLPLISHGHGPTQVTQPSSSVTDNATFSQSHSSLMGGSSFLLW